MLTLKAVQTLAGEKDSRFATWFDALEWMTNRALEMDFDIALIGCGAYGFPLAANLKKAGKQAIHLGGALQLMFGIKGNRWEGREVSRYFNQYWCRPDETEKVSNMNLTEENCYW